MKSIDYARLCVDSVMARTRAEDLPPADRFHYHQGVFLAGVEQIYNITGEEKYREYIKRWTDFNIDENGYAKNCVCTEFDDIEPANLLFDLYSSTGDKRYKTLLDRLYAVIMKWPVNSEGGVWHKYRCPNQMWLDSMYMMGVFSARYAKAFGKTDIFDKALRLMNVMRKRMLNPETGLMYHMYDESRRNRFVDSDGLIRVHWGRAMGWYASALAEMYELFPRHDIAETERELIGALAEYQSDAGLWYQVTDMPRDPRNWYETSSSALFTYAAAKSLRLGIVGAEYEKTMINGFKGVLTKVTTDGGFGIEGICVGTGVGPLGYYFDRPTSENDLHGMGAFLLMCAQIHKYSGGEI
ncbi:MAG: glycoside hydrolase family 88 protein [Firmicutes bacterium]|nr:glycoside hydrolase family 88 protein [Bacillota bacterium]